MPIRLEAASRLSVVPANAKARTSAAGAITIANRNRAAFTIIEPAPISLPAEQCHSGSVFQKGFPNPHRSPRSGGPHSGRPDIKTETSPNITPKYRDTVIETPVRQTSSSSRVARNRRPHAGASTTRKIISAQPVSVSAPQGSGTVIHIAIYSTE